MEDGHEVAVYRVQLLRVGRGRGIQGRIVGEVDLDLVETYQEVRFIAQRCMGGWH
jgi:hypothetical protein